jgi:hypothetical protein
LAFVAGFFDTGLGGLFAAGRFFGGAADDSPDPLWAEILRPVPGSKGLTNSINAATASTT